MPSTVRGQRSLRQLQSRPARPEGYGLFEERQICDGLYNYGPDSFLPPMPPISPPLPYEVYSSPHRGMMPSQSARVGYSGSNEMQYVRQIHREAMFQVPQTAWASTSTVDLSHSVGPRAWAQEQRWHDDRSLRTMATANPHNLYVDGRGTSRYTPGGHRTATRLNDVLSRAEDDFDSPEELREVLGWLDLNEADEIVERAGSGVRLGAPGPKPVKESRKAAGHRIINFNKTWMYQNSRLPPGMVPFNVYLPTWTLICRAVQASMDVYTRPPKSQRQQYLDADPKRGIKATIIKSQPVDDRKLLIVAIRGSQWKLVDWTVNFAASPSPPKGFLDDEGNACHAGFLAIARAMVPAVAAQLRRLVQDEPEWITSSVLFTGHSAGGAVASLLYSHMLSSQISELTALAGVFKRVHCVTFGVPPISLLPLQVPASRAHQKNQFLSFVNEGDPIVRADRPYVLSLIKLFAEPAPCTTGSRPNRLRAKLSCQALRSRGSLQQITSARPTWPVPEATLSTAGRLVLLREKVGSEQGAVEAVQLTDGELRNLIFGDLTKHHMTMYKERLDTLAFAAVTGRDGG